MYDNQLDYRAIQRRADAVVKRQQARVRLGLFVVNFFLYLSFMAVIWAVYLTRDDYSTMFMFGALAMLSAGWAVGLFLHGASLWVNSERGSKRRRERAVAREIAREMARQGIDEHDLQMSMADVKAKRRERLMDDGDEAIRLADLIEREPTLREDIK
jgi:uncharacterized membrane protein YcjF (UPF0283 family)